MIDNANHTYLPRDDIFLSALSIDTTQMDGRMKSTLCVFTRKKRFLVWTGSEYIYGFPNSNCALANSTIESGGMQLVKDVLFIFTV